MTKGTIFYIYCTNFGWGNLVLDDDGSQWRKNLAGPPLKLPPVGSGGKEEDGDRNARGKSKHSSACLLLGRWNQEKGITMLFPFFFFLRRSFALVTQAGVQWLFTSSILAHCSLELLASSDPPASVSWIAGTTDAGHQAWLWKNIKTLYDLYLEMWLLGSWGPKNMEVHKYNLTIKNWVKMPNCSMTRPVESWISPCR